MAFEVYRGIVYGVLAAFIFIFAFEAPESTGNDILGLLKVLPYTPPVIFMPSEFLFLPILE
jgi:hypothetical protein